MLNSRFFVKLREFFAKLKDFFAKLNFSAICGTQGGGKALKKQACSIETSQSETSNRNEGNLVGLFIAVKYTVVSYQGERFSSK